VPLLLNPALTDDRLAWYRGVGDPALLRTGGRFIAEGRRVVARLLEQLRWGVESVLVSPAALPSIEPAALQRPELPVFVLPLDKLTEFTGFNFHRGCLAVAFRGKASAVEDVVPPVPRPALVLGLEGLADADNVGAAFRNAAAFGVDAVLLDRACTDPLYRKAIRTSMGATLRVPFARVESWPPALAQLSGSMWTVALTPASDAVDISSLGSANVGARRLLLIGSEGCGLRAETLDACQLRARIPMAPGVDSLNAATAAAVALHAVASQRAPASCFQRDESESGASERRGWGA
jgi:tRNA G18 (ribose-2'-O)-methylase SpoU